MNAAVTAVDEIYVDWFWAITDRALDPRRPLVTEEGFRDNLAACKFEVRSHYNNPSLKILRYMVAACLWNHFFGHEGVDDPPNFLTRPQYIPLEWLPLDIKSFRELALRDRSLEEPTLLGEHQGQPQRIRGIQQPPLDIESEERIGIPGPDALIEANGNEPLGLDTHRSWSEYLARRFALNYTSIVEGSSLGAGKGADDDVREA
ncbi:hypothetical protein BGAL_0022g00150 [Botrytis galanthina]|uniref:Uncharacterized protein n=1 Tax=Botrytis galanthina TaxID=278940 RepID=A0A4S8RIX3_9HELO|nr:hypothetical protein BGAL_0022g00150 [Botrytis galanthina]